MMNVNIEKCVGCGQCVKDCFANTIELVDGKAKINNDNCIKCGHCIAICPREAVSTDEYNMKEVKKYNKDEFSVDGDNLLNFIKFRRSVRQFKDKPVEEEKIHKIIEAGRYTETGANAQDVSFTVVREGIQELKRLAIETLNEQGKNLLNNPAAKNMQYKIFADMWIKMYEEFKANPDQNDNLFHNAPALIVVTADSEMDGALASSNMEIMTNALGLGTFICGFFAIAAEDNQKIIELLRIKEGKKIVSCMVVGYPGVKYFRTVPRKEADINWI